MKKQQIIIAAGWLAWLLMLGVVGGMEHGAIRPSSGIIGTFSLLAAGSLSMWKAGVLK